METINGNLSLKLAYGKLLRGTETQWGNLAIRRGTDVSFSLKTWSSAVDDWATRSSIASVKGTSDSCSNYHPRAQVPQEHASACRDEEMHVESIMRPICRVPPVSYGRNSRRQGLPAQRLYDGIRLKTGPNSWMVLGRITEAPTSNCGRESVS